MKLLGNLCVVCQKAVEGKCEKYCHATEWINSKKYSLTGHYDLTQGAYVPKACDKAALRLYIMSNKVRAVEEDDANRLRVPLLLIEYKGKGHTQTLKAYHFVVADMGIVGKTFCEFAVIAETETSEGASKLSGPYRKSIKSNTVYVIKARQGA